MWRIFRLFDTMAKEVYGKSYDCLKLWEQETVLDLTADLFRRKLLNLKTLFDLLVKGEV